MLLRENKDVHSFSLYIYSNIVLYIQHIHELDITFFGLMNICFIHQKSCISWFNFNILHILQNYM